MEENKNKIDEYAGFEFSERIEVTLHFPDRVVHYSSEGVAANLYEAYEFGGIYRWELTLTGLNELRRQFNS